MQRECPRSHDESRVELVDIDRLSLHVVSARADRLREVLAVTKAGHEHEVDISIALGPAHVLAKIQTRHSRQDPVTEDDVDLSSDDLRAGRMRIADGASIVSKPLEREEEEPPRVDVVLDDENTKRRELEGHHSGRASEERLEDVDQRVDIDRLGQVATKTRRNPSLTVTLQRRGGERDHGDRPRGRIRLQATERLDTTHPWKIDIHENNRGISRTRELHRMVTCRVGHSFGPDGPPPSVPWQLAHVARS